MVPAAAFSRLAVAELGDLRTDVSAGLDQNASLEKPSFLAAEAALAGPRNRSFSGKR